MLQTPVVRVHQKYGLAEFRSKMLILWLNPTLDGHPRTWIVYNRRRCHLFWLPRQVTHTQLWMSATLTPSMDVKRKIGANYSFSSSCITRARLHHNPGSSQRAPLYTQHVVLCLTSTQNLYAPFPLHNLNLFIEWLSFCTIGQHWLACWPTYLKVSDRNL